MGSKTKRFLIIVSAVLLACILCLTYGYWEARNIEIRETTFSDEDIPASFAGKKIIFVSDIHCNRYFTSADVKDLVQQINERNPDIIMLGGDYILKDTTYTNPFFKEIKNLKSTYGVYSVLGNHDHWEDAKLIQKGLTDCGFFICDNQSYWIKEGNDSIKVGGVGDFWEDKQLIGNTINDVEKSDFCILLSHNPDYVELLNTNKVDLMLSGHTHGGQITFFGLYAPAMPSTDARRKDLGYLNTEQKYRYGWKEKDGIKLYITSGIGMGAVPFRFFAPPEILEITLTR